MKRSTTKKALLMSGLAVVMAISMLVGTTFAWFTDSVASGTNTIVAGNLDIELWNGDKEVEGLTTDPAFFDAVKLWEPGAMAFETFTVKNVGNLALKYILEFHVTEPTAGVSLADILQIACVKGEINPDERINPEDYSWQPFEYFSKSGSLEGCDDVKDANSDTYTFIVWWKPSDNDNDYNMNNDKQGTASVDFSVSLFATQDTVEADGFDNYYDGGAMWLGDYDYSWYDADATEFTVGSAEQLAALAALVNGTAVSPVATYSGESAVNPDNFAGKTITLVSDVDLNEMPWTPIGTVDHPFAGTFDGAGYTIDGLAVSNTNYAAFIAYAASSAVIKDVTLANVNINSNKHAAGVVCIASEGITIENVTVSGTIVAASYAGGILHNAANATITGCKNYADVTAIRAAGIASWVTSNANIANTENYGDVVGTAGASGIAHGFAGTISGCTNNGDITVTANGIEPSAGIAGVQKADSVIENCVNNGNITSNGSDLYNASAGGILGHNPGSKTTITGCTNNGDVVATVSASAGIGTSLYGGITATNCVNNGNVTGAKSADGVVAEKGMISSSNTVTDCTNNGTVTLG